MKKVALFMIAAAWLLTACGGSSAPSSSAPSSSAVDSSAVDSSAIDSDVASQDVDASSQTASVDTSAKRTATVQVGTEVFVVEGQSCLYSSDFFQLSGVGRSETNTAMVDISGNLNEDYDSDGVNDPAATVALDLETGAAFGPVEAGPADLVAESLSFSATEGVGIAMFDFELDWAAEASTMTGSGEIEDYSGILIPFGERLPLTFTATC